MALATTLARKRLYYGWYIVGVLFTSSFLSVGLNGNAPGLFLKPMTTELQWSRGFFSSVIYLGTLMTVPLSMVLWPRVDRRGARGVMLVSGVIMGLGVAAQGLVHTQWQFFLVKSVILPFGTVGVGPMMSMLVVSNWFVKQRGRALSWTAMGSSSAGIALPPLITYLISAFGWRNAWFILGTSAAVISVVTVYLFMQRNPEDLGLLPDGAKTPITQESTTTTQPGEEVTWTRRDVLRTPTFWFLALALPFGYMGMGVVQQHLVPYLTDIHYSAQGAARVMMVVSTVSLISKIPWGFIMERWASRYCFAICFAFFGAGMGTLTLGGTSLFATVLAAVFLGMGWGGNSPLQGMIWVEYYGRGNQGMARSLATPASQVSGMLGPALAGYVWDMTGTYNRIFLAYMAAPLAGIALVLLARPPKKPAARERPGPEKAAAN